MKGRGAMGAVIAFLLFCPGVAQATQVDIVGGSRPGYTIYPARNWLGFHLRAARGYSVSVTVEARTARLEVIGSDAVVVYEAPATKVGNKVRVRFGDLGKLVMGFEPAGPFRISTEPQGDCRGPRALIQKGTFRGYFRWRGEKNFSRVGTREAQGVFVRTFREVCRGETAAIGRDEAPKPLVVARSQFRRHLREVETYAYPDGAILIIGRVLEERPRMSIDRRVFSDVEAGGFWVDPEGDTIITSTPPFRGTAEAIGNSAEAERWRGSLEADFPGRGFLPLAGGSFKILSQ